MNTFFSSDQVSASDRVALWHDVICRSYVPLNITLTSEQPFIGTVSTGNLGTVRIATSSSLPQQITRTRRLIRQDEREYLMVGVQSAGHALVQQHDRTARVGRGGLVFWDTRHPYDILFPTDWRMSVFQFPRYSFGFTEDFIGRMTAVNVGGDRGIGRVVSSFMTSINDATDAGDLAEVAPLHNSAVDLLSAAIRTELADQAAASDGLLECVLAYIRQNLADPNLCASQIAAEHNVSVRTLHRLFSATGQGVAEHIRNLRLERIKTELADPTSRRYTISALARKWGFLDPSTFSRAFKDAYGITAREWAACASAPPTEVS